MVDPLTGSQQAPIGGGSKYQIGRFPSVMTVSVTSSESHEGSATSGFWGLMLGSIGVVFGDIGTSPLYAFREAVAGAAGHGQPATRAIVLGVLSLILWALFTVVTAKYVLLLLRADNNGAGRFRLRARHGDMVRNHCGAGHRSHQRRSVGAGSDQSLVRHPFPADARHHRTGDAGRGVSRGHRRRGALCRSRSFRPQTNPV